MTRANRGTRERGRMLGAVLFDKPFDLDDPRRAVAPLLRRSPLRHDAVSGMWDPTRPFVRATAYERLPGTACQTRSSTASSWSTSPAARSSGRRSQPLLAGVAAHGWLRARYASLQGDLAQNAAAPPQFSHAVLAFILRDAENAAGRSGEPNVQAIIEDRFQSDLKSLLLAERFLRAATGLVLVLGLLGTFYGLTLSIGKLVHLVASDAGVTPDIAQTMTRGLTEALAGMAVAFSNSLVGIASAVVLTILGVVNNVTDRRTALMVQIETYLDRYLAASSRRRQDAAASVDSFGASVARLESAVARFESALRAFAASTKDSREVQLVVAVKPGDGR